MSTPFAAADFGLSGAARATSRELLAVLRLALFLPADGRDVAGRESAIVAMLAGALAAWIAIDPLLHSRELVFSWYALPNLACVAAGVLLVAWLLEKLCRPALALRRALVLTLGVLPVGMVAEIASWTLVDSVLRLLYPVLTLYALGYFARGTRVLTGRLQPIALLAAALATTAMVLALDYLQARPRLWVRAEERLDRINAAGADWVRMARVQFMQQSRIDGEIAKLAPQADAVPEMYFLGFAGYGQEAVFAREIELAAQVVDRRFGSGRRSLRLVNDRRDVDSWPLASEPGLRHALRRLGDVMGDEDVLFLVLSSHGDRGQGVRVSNAGMVTTRVDPVSLEQMLRDAGIGWRVIVVSACYSGGFVEALANERSIVITAAAADRKSFGCNDSRRLTYFGEAFFEQALAGGGSLREAFQAARSALERKERAAGITPSLPQASFGALIEQRLGRPTRVAGRDER